MEGETGNHSSFEFHISFCLFLFSCLYFVFIFIFLFIVVFLLAFNFCFSQFLHYVSVNAMQRSL